MSRPPRINTTGGVAEFCARMLCAIRSVVRGFLLAEIALRGVLLAEYTRTGIVVVDTQYCSVDTAYMVVMIHVVRDLCK